MKKRLAIAVAAVVVGLGIVGVLLLWSEKTPDPQELSLSESVDYLASGKFQKLDEEERDKFARGMIAKLPEGRPWELMRNEELRKQMESQSEEDRARLRENAGYVIRVAFRELLDEFFDLPPEEQNEKLDEWLDQRDRAGDGGKGHGRGSSNNPETRRRRTKDLLERTTPEDRAKFREFLRRMGARRKQRGG